MLNKNYLFSLLNMQASAKSRTKSRQCKRTLNVGIQTIVYIFKSKMYHNWWLCLSLFKTKTFPSMNKNVFSELCRETSFQFDSKLFCLPWITDLHKLIFVLHKDGLFHYTLSYKHSGRTIDQRSQVQRFKSSRRWHKEKIVESR